MSVKWSLAGCWKQAQSQEEATIKTLAKIDNEFPINVFLQLDGGLDKPSFELGMDEWHSIVYAEGMTREYITMTTMASQITSLTIVYSTVYSDAEPELYVYTSIWRTYCES